VPRQRFQGSRDPIAAAEARTIEAVRAIHGWCALGTVLHVTHRPDEAVRANTVIPRTAVERDDLMHRWMLPG
jgi:hypothetical protein